MTSARIAPARPLAILASYPRSGNTFLRALLANAQSGLDRPLTVGEIAHYGTGEKNEAFWRACTRSPAETRTLHQEWSARPAYLALTRALPGSGPVMFKSHSHNGVAYGVRAFEIQPGDRIIYLVRHPFDVVLSAAPFYGLALDQMVDRLILPGAFNDEGGVGPFEPTGSWLENVAGWLNETRCPLHLLRYEDLFKDPVGALDRALSFLGAATSPDRLRSAVAFASFETLRFSHDRGGFDQGPRRDRHAPFFREGRLDQWKTDLPAPLQTKLSQALGDLMDILGFEKTP